ncbi:cytokine receptor-like isoform X2 [Artemia franciscana]|uniref:cytokine receptor-like isoform X2 n=1 Tax=Artemia franciscana TaxID=6661 RepID=UPI0032D9EFDC
MIGHVLFLLQVLFPISYACTGFTGSIGQVYPLEDPKVVVGDTYKLTCVLDPGPSEEFTAKDLFFTIGDKPLSDVLIDGTWSVALLNDSAAELTVNDSSPYPGARYVYYCRAKSSIVTKERTVCMRYVYVGLPPSNVTDFKCISENLDSLTCTWVTTPNPIKANYDLYYKSEGKMIYHCPNNTRFNIGSVYGCKWTLGTFPIYAVNAPLLSFTLNISNALGNLTQNLGELDHFAYVRPAPVEEMEVTALGPRLAQVSFSIPVNMYSLPKGLVFKVVYKIIEPWLPTPFIKEVNTESVDPSLKEVSISVALPHPNLHYEFEVSSRSFTANESLSYLWSDVESSMVRAHPAVPESPPNVTIGSFELIKQSYGKRGVFIYWQKLEEKFKNGDGFHYEVVVYDRLGRRLTFENNVDIREAYAKFDYIGNEACTFVISAVNNVGASVNTSEILVPHYNDVEIVPYPRALTKVSYDNGTYDLVWNNSTSSAVEGYIIFWCNYYNDRPYQCDGTLNWTYVPSDQTSIRVNFPNREAIYQFAISSFLAGISSGMRWAACTILSNNVLDKITEFEINGVSNTSLSIRWKLECADSTAYIDHFNIYYCPFNIYFGECSGKNETKQVDSMLDSYVITNLEPATDYIVQISASAGGNDGRISDPAMNTTAQGIPSPPANVVAEDITNASLTVVWFEPLKPNGQIIEYKVERGEFSETTMTTSHQFGNLTGYTDYKIGIRACTLVGCSEPISSVFRTKIGVPGTVGRPIITITDENGNLTALVEWSSPNPPSGPQPRYRINVTSFIPSSTDDECETETWDVGPVNFTQVSLELCGKDDKKYSYNITVQAYNALDDNELFEGQWSKVTTQECIGGIYIGTTVIVVVCCVIGFAVVIIAFILGGSRLQKKYVNSMSAAKTVQFPWGSGSTIMFKKDAVDDKEMRGNTSTASIKPLFDRINPDLTFSDVAMSERTAETHLEGELKDSQSSVTSSGISSGKDSEDKSVEVRLKSRQSMDSGAFLDSTGDYSCRETSGKKQDVDRSASLCLPKTSAEVTVSSLPEGYSRFGVEDKKTLDSKDRVSAGYVPYPSENIKSSPSLSGRSTSSESSLLQDKHYVLQPKIVSLKRDDFELCEKPLSNKDKNPNSYISLPLEDEDNKLSQGYAHVGMGPSMGYVPAPDFKKSTLMEMQNFPKSFKMPEYQAEDKINNWDPSTLADLAFKMPDSPNKSEVGPAQSYVHIGLDTNGKSEGMINSKSCISDICLDQKDIQVPIPPEGYVQVGIENKSQAQGYIPTLPDFKKDKKNCGGYVTVDSQ